MTTMDIARWLVDCFNSNTGIQQSKAHAQKTAAGAGGLAIETAEYPSTWLTLMHTGGVFQLNGGFVFAVGSIGELIHFEQHQGARTIQFTGLSSRMPFMRSYQSNLPTQEAFYLLERTFACDMKTLLTDFRMFMSQYRSMFKDELSEVKRNEEIPYAQAKDHPRSTLPVLTAVAKKTSGRLLRRSVFNHLGEVVVTSRTTAELHVDNATPSGLARLLGRSLG